MTFAYGQQFSWKSHEPTLAPPHQGLLWTMSLEKSHTSCILVDSGKPRTNVCLTSSCSSLPSGTTSSPLLWLAPAGWWMQPRGWEGPWPPAQTAPPWSWPSPRQSAAPGAGWTLLRTCPPRSHVLVRYIYWTGNWTSHSPDILMSQSGRSTPVKSIWSTRPVTMVHGLASESAGFRGFSTCLKTAKW